jgi:prevent-host-death family protein
MAWPFHGNARQVCAPAAESGNLARAGQIGNPRVSIYSIAKAKDNLSKLVDEALSGGDVAITRHGKVVAYLRSAAERPIRQPSQKLVARIMARAKRRPRLEEPAADIVRRMRDEFP